MSAIDDRDFRVGDVLTEAFELYVRFFGRFVALSLVVFFITGVPTALAQTASDPTAQGVWIVVGLIVALVGYFWLEGALTLATNDARNGRIDTTIPRLFIQTRTFLPFLVGAGLLVSVAMGIAVAALVIGTSAAGIGQVGGILSIGVALFLLTRCVIAIPLVVLENSAPIAALRESWGLVHGKTGRVFGVIILSSIIAGIASTIVSSAITHAIAGFAGAWIASTVVGALTSPFVVLAWALPYFHLREGDGPLVDLTAGRNSTRVP